MSRQPQSKSMLKINKCGRYILLILFGLILIACTRNIPKGVPAYNKIVQSVQSGIEQDRKIARRHDAEKMALIQKIRPNLLSSNSSNPQKPAASERRFNVSANDIAAQQFFLALTKDSGQNIIVNPKISGNISLELNNVTLEEALTTIESVYGYVYRKTAIGYEIFPNDILEAEIFHVNYLNATRSGTSNTEITSGEIVDTSTTTSGATSSSTSSKGGSASGSSILTSYKIDFWKDLENSLRAMLGTEGGRSVVTNALAGTVLVRAYPKELKAIRKYLDLVQLRMNRQVIIEAKILEVQLNDDYQMGIQWEKLTGNFTGTDLKNVSLPTDGGVVALGNSVFGNLIKFNNGKFSMIISALSTQGRVNVLSSPRLSTMNNQKAVIKVGTNEFFVTNVSNTTSGTEGNIVTQDIELTPFFEGISLDLIPQVNDQKEITLHIRPSISDITEDNKVIQLQDQDSTLPTAKSTIRESDNIVSAKNKQVIVIGGLMQTKNNETINRLPFLGRLPFVGSIFRDTDQERKNIELVILLKPTIVENGTWSESLAEHKKEFADFKHGFHLSEYSNLYGVEGETENFRSWKNSKSSSGAPVKYKKNSQYNMQK
jgi:MSHA biogenesis protein MshL